MIDLFVVVNNYKEAYPGPMLRTFNVLLPPNVFYLEVGPAEERLHAKYSVLSRAHLDKGTSRWFHSYCMGSTGSTLPHRMGERRRGQAKSSHGARPGGVAISR